MKADSTPRSGILAGGNWIVDKLKFIDTYPQQDALANVLAESLGNGGSPFNILTDLAKLGVSIPLAGVGLIGSDADGKWILAECARHRINADQIRILRDAHTSYTDVMVVRSTGRRTFFHQRGVNAFLNDEHFDFSSNSAKIFHLGYLLLLDGMDRPDPEFGTVAARTLCRAKKAGFLTSIDVVSEDSQRFKEVVLPALPHVDFCILNEFEISRTTGIEVKRGAHVDLHAVQLAAQILLRAGVAGWVVVHFPGGACAIGHDGQVRFQGSLNIPQSKIVSTVGAGDAFAAGFLFGLHEEASIEKALKLGILTAGSCLFGKGTSDGILPLEKCIKLEEQFGIRSGGKLAPHNV
jgi:sugar/nucleoside kinase (ribokinase family)